MDALKKILDLLTPRERKQLYLLVPAVTLMGLLEVAGIASIAPFLSVVTDPGVIQTNPVLAWLYDVSGVQSDQRFLFLLGMLVLLVLAVTNGISALTYWALYRYGTLRNHTISERLLDQYLQQPYEFFLQRNTAELINNVMQEVNEVVNSVIVPGLQVIAKTVAALFIIGLLVVVDPLLALVIGALLGGAYAVIYAAIRARVSMLGSARVQANRERLKATSEAIGGIKELRLLGREQEPMARYRRPSYIFAVSHAASKVLGMLPRYALETVAFGGVLIIILVLIASGETTAQVIPIVGLYAFAGYRLLPALNTVFSGMTKIQFGLPSVHEVHAILGNIDTARSGAAAPRTTDAPALPFEDAIRLERVGYAYATSDDRVLRDIDLEIGPNTWVAFVGETGSGKTTLADLILGLLEPTSGAITVDGVRLADDAIPRWQQNIGYVPQHIYLSDDTIARNIAFGIGAEDVDMDAVRKAAHIAQIDSFIEGLSAGYETTVGDRGIRLSGGQRQRLGIARAVYHNPAVLVLDEATSALDNVTEARVFATLDQIAHTKTVIMIAHRLSTVKGCDVIHLLHDGRLEASGTYAELLALSRRFREMVARSDSHEPAAPVASGPE